MWITCEGLQVMRSELCGQCEQYMYVNVIYDYVMTMANEPSRCQYTPVVYIYALIIRNDY